MFVYVSVCECVSERSRTKVSEISLPLLSEKSVMLYMLALFCVEPDLTKETEPAALPSNF